METLRRRETQLDDAWVYGKRINSGTYERQRDKLREDIALCRIELEDARVEEIDVEGLLGFAEHVLGAAAGLLAGGTRAREAAAPASLVPGGTLV